MISYNLTNREEAVIYQNQDHADDDANRKEEFAGSNQSFRHLDDQVFKDIEGAVYNPLASQNTYAIFTFNCICCIIGLLASGRVIYKTVVTCNQDGWRPRHVLLIGTIVSCILTLLVHCFIPAVYFLWPNDDLCRFFVLSFRLPYIAFLFNILSALIDRYVAVTRSIWHRTAVTKKYCIIWLSLLNLLLAMAVKWSFIAQVDSVECAFNIIHILSVAVAILVLFILCTGFLIALFIVTWRQLPQAARAIPVPPFQPSPIIDEQPPPTPPPINPADIEYVALKDLLPPEEIPIPTAVVVIKRSSSPKVIDPSSIELHRLELEVTKHLLFTLLPLFTFLVPLTTLGFSIIGCLYFFPNEPDYAATLISYII